MTFAEKIEQVRKDDPNFAKSVKRIRIASWLFGAGVVVALAFGVWAVVVNSQQATQITRVQRSACEVDAAGFECQQTRRESSRAANLYTTCIPFFKAGYPCPKPGSRTAQNAAHEGVAPSTGNPPSSPPGPPSQGGHQGDHGNGGAPGPTEPSPGVTGPPPTAPTLTPSPVSESANDHLPEAASPSAEPPGLLDPTLNTVRGTVCSVNPAGIRVCTP